MAFETLRLSDLMEGARNACINFGNVKNGEKVLIVTDTKTDFRRVEAIACVCREVGAEVTTMIMKAAEIPNQEPPATVAEAMRAADIVIAPLFITISHTKARNACIAAGARYLGMYAYDIEELACEGARFPAEIIFRVTQIVRDQWLKGKKITVTCGKGSNLSAKMDPQYVVGWEGCVGPLGTYHKNGTWLERFGNFAGGFGVVGGRAMASDGWGLWWFVERGGVGGVGACVFVVSDAAAFCGVDLVVGGVCGRSELGRSVGGFGGCVGGDLVGDVGSG